MNEVANAAGTKVQSRLAEIFEKVTKKVILLLLFAQAVRVEADVLEHIPEFSDVCFFDGMKCLVDPLAIARLVSPGLLLGPTPQSINEILNFVSAAGA